MTLSFHVRHEVTPERCYEVLNAWVMNQSYDQITQANRQLGRLRQLGLIAEDQPVNIGQITFKICQKKPTLWGDLLHFLHYTLWLETKSEENGFSWTYRAFTDYLWQKQEIKLDGDFWQPVVSTLSGQIESSPLFAQKIAAITKDGTISLSKDSLSGIINWLQALTPPVVEHNVFTRRSFCPPELTLLAAGWVAQTTEGEPGIDFLITPPRREAICRLCLLEPNALDSVLDWMLPNYPHLVQPGTSAGVYGRYLRFLKWPEVTDLI